MKKIILILIIIFAFGLRLYRINGPIADWHSWRQADTSAVSRNFIKGGFDLSRPRFDDLSNVASGKDNPEGYRFVEFPIYNFLQAGFFKLFPFLSLEVWGRLVSIFASLGALIFIHLLAKKYLDQNTALWAAFFYAVLPFNIYYSRAILPEAIMNFAWLGMLYFFDSKKYLPAVFFAAGAFLLKPYTLVFLLPITYLAWQQWHFNWQKWLLWILGVLICIAPFAIWRIWMKQYPEGIPDYSWLLNKTGVRLRGAWWWWLFGERLGKLILGFWGLIPFGLGLASKPSNKGGWFFHTWLLSILAYLMIIADGNVRHDYYQVMTVPVICIFLAQGAHFLWSAANERLSIFASRCLLLASVVFMLAFSWYQVRDYFNINNRPIVHAGQAADRLLPADAKVIAPYGGDTAFLYQTNRQGWPVGIDIPEMIKKGAQYYVNISFDQEVEWVSQQWCVLQRTDGWIIVDLTKLAPCN